MRFSLLSLAPILAINLSADLYIYDAIKKRARHFRFWMWLHNIVCAVSLIATLYLGISLGSNPDNPTFVRLMWAIAIVLSLSIARYLFVVFDLIARIPQLFHRNRFKPFTWLGVLLSVISFLTIWWGVFIGRYKITEVPVSVEIENLPDSFNGFRICQISDLHVGSFGTDTTFVSRLVDEINSLNPDLVLFSGDIVNRDAKEMEPFVKPLSRLKGRYGQYAVMGNHDYGDYYQWDSEQEHLADIARLDSLYSQTSMRLLRDEHVYIDIDGDTLVIIGVENIGAPPFRNSGSLMKAYPTPGDSHTKILLSHDPWEWGNEIADNPDINIPLTLSGHTHAMQCRILGFSPASWKYDRWAGLYADRSGKAKLYINVGDGTIGLPARIGAFPEITLITLEKK